MPDASSRYLGQFRPEFSRLYEDRDLYWITPFHAPHVLGVVGARFAGVSSVIDYLTTRYGYRPYTLGSELRRIAEERGVPIGHRRYLQDLGDQIRTEEKDAAYLARLVLRRIRTDYLSQPVGTLPRSVVIGGIKTAKELAVFTALHNFKPIEVQVEDPTLRYRRASEHGELEEEYEADRARKQAAERGLSPLPPWEGLSKPERRAYFDELDRIHAEGHPGGWPDEYKGTPAEVIARLNDPIPLGNDGSLRDLHAEIDANPMIRTAHQLGY